MYRRRAHGDRGIASAIVEPVLAALAALGFDAGRFARMASDGSAGVIGGPAADRILDAAASQLSDDAIGLSVASRIPIGALGPLDYAFCTSPVLREALRRLARHYAVVTRRVTLRLVDDPPRGALALERQPGMDHSRHWIEFSLAMIAERMRQTVGGAMLFEEVHFVHSPPANPARHEAFFGARVLFGQPRDRMSFASTSLDEPLRTAAKYLSDILDERLEEIERSALADDPLVDRARRTILALLDDGRTDADLVATRLHMSRRTLQRELKARGTTHKDLLDDIRRERAVRLLGEGHRTIADVASHLGFSDERAFFRAFHRWTGTTPNAFRNAPAVREPR
jgi:AraC-like DNA-binding protein